MGELVHFGERQRAELQPGPEAGEELDALARRVIGIVAHQTGQRPERVELGSQLERDLGCTGEEAIMLMGRIASEFGIDMRGFRLERHFGGEGSLKWPVIVALVVALPSTIVVSHLVGLVMRSTGWQAFALLSPGLQFAIIYAACAGGILGAMTLLPSAVGRRARTSPITVKHLVEAARTRRWMIDVSESRAP